MQTDSGGPSDDSVDAVIWSQKSVRSFESNKSLDVSKDSQDDNQMSGDSDE